MRLALIGDIHVFQLRVAPWELLGKRLLGQMNLWLNRRRKFNAALLPTVIERAVSLRPDLLLFSGDLTTTALEGEFAVAASVLRQATAGRRTLVIPGNHDRYTYSSCRAKRFERHFAGLSPASYPHLESLTPRWRLLALDAAVPRIISARGRLGRSQLAATRDIVAGLTEDDGLAVLCHYPFCTPPGIDVAWDHALAEAGPLADILRDCKAQVVYMHGHVHRPWLYRPAETTPARVLTLNAGSPCQVTAEFPLGQGFWQIDLSDDPDAPVALTRHTPVAGEMGAVGWEERAVL